MLEPKARASRVQSIAAPSAPNVALGTCKGGTLRSWQVERDIEEVLIRARGINCKWRCPPRMVGKGGRLLVFLYEEERWRFWICSSASKRRGRSSGEKEKKKRRKKQEASRPGQVPTWSSSVRCKSRVGKTAKWVDPREAVSWFGVGLVVPKGNGRAMALYRGSIRM